MRMLLSTGAGLAALTASAFADTEIIELTPACETALALSAGPAYLREDAGVYVLGPSGFEMARETRNGYRCMVVRENLGGLVPQCFDPASEHAHLKVHLEEAEMQRQGLSSDAIRAARGKGFADGTYRPVEGHGVVYMASAYNYVLTPGGDRILVKPHVMYHAPNVSNDDIGAVFPDTLNNAGMPFMNNEGPLGFMIGFVERATDSTDVEAHCAGQLPDLEDWRVFPAE